MKMVMMTSNWYEFLCSGSGYAVFIFHSFIRSFAFLLSARLHIRRVHISHFAWMTTKWQSLNVNVNEFLFSSSSIYVAR